MTGLLCTHSRGGLLSLVAAIGVLMTFRYGTRVAIAGALVGIPGMLVLGTRQTSIDIEDGTAQDRIQLWSDGLDALKSADFFFGIGMGEYGDMAGLVAHNSFVHAYTELGIVGGTLFFGMFYFAFLELYRFRYVAREVPDRTLRRVHPFLFAVLTGWTMSLMSLSRCYVVPTYLIIGLVAAAFQNQAGPCWFPRVCSRSSTPGTSFGGRGRASAVWRGSLCSSSCLHGGDEGAPRKKSQCQKAKVNVGQAVPDTSRKARRSRSCWI